MNRFSLYVIAGHHNHIIFNFRHTNLWGGSNTSSGQFRILKQCMVIH